jgi:hypothetical protein
MSHSGQSDVHIQDLLSAITDALLTEETNLDLIVERYNVPRAQVEGAVILIRRLHQALVGVQPSRRYVRSLKQDLVGTPDNNLINRVRYLPPRVQIAAGVALLAGFMIFTRRRMLADARATAITPEIHALQ